MGDICQCVQWAAQGGFSGNALYYAAAIAMAESSGNPDPGSTFTPDVNGGTSGLMQFNAAEWQRWGAKYGPISDPVANMKAAYDFSGGGTNFDPWCTSTAEMNSTGRGGCNGYGGATAGKFVGAAQGCGNPAATPHAAGNAANNPGGGILGLGDLENALKSIGGAAAAAERSTQNKLQAAGLIALGSLVFAVGAWFVIGQTDVGREFEHDILQGVKMGGEAAVLVPK